MEPLLYNVHVRDLKFYIYLGKMLRLLGDFVPHTPDLGSAPGPRWGTPIPQTPAPPLQESLAPPLAPQLWQAGAATAYGISKTIIKWIQVFLTARTFIVRVNLSHSAWSDVTWYTPGQCFRTYFISAVY